ncbi:MAG: metallophosphoesterase [Oscillospiraceae bacterium]|nr:metallophosphoesterase [Oscillospiraceae bacterium]
MKERRARIEKLNLPENGRVLVMSDIHANVPYFYGALEQSGFCDRDTLIIDGDFLEKGTESLRLLRLLTELEKQENVHVVCGNCDDWADMYVPDFPDAANDQILKYIQFRRGGLLWDMSLEQGIDPLEVTDFRPLRKLFYDEYPEVWDFLGRIPHALESERFVFAHAGMTPGKALKEHRPEELDRVNALLKTDRRFERWLVVGHWPVMLYGENTVCANPILERDRKIISIDGGCTLKDDGQLNCLIIPDWREDVFTYTAYDPFPVVIAGEDQAEGDHSWYIRWGDSEVRVLQRGEEFSRCRHVRTGYEMDILTRYLYSDQEISTCNDSTDYILPVRAGDELRLVESTSRGILCKRNGVSGWYAGSYHRK